MIRISVEGKRGCGFRKAGGLYLVAGKPERDCGKLPLPLEVCPCCGQGIKVSRGFTWVDPVKLFTGVNCAAASNVDATEGASGTRCVCPLADHHLPKMGKAGLLWVGEKFYSTPKEFLEEGFQMGISRRISSIPHGFKIGETWILFAHRKAIGRRCEHCSGTGMVQDPEWNPNEVGPSKRIPCPECEGAGQIFTAGIFGCFRPTAIEYIVKPDDTPEELAAIEKRGISLVKVIPMDPESQNPLPLFPICDGCGLTFNSVSQVGLTDGPVVSLCKNCLAEGSVAVQRARIRRNSIID